MLACPAKGSQSGQHRDAAGQRKRVYGHKAGNDPKIRASGGYEVVMQMPFVRIKRRFTHQYSSAKSNECVEHGNSAPQEQQKDEFVKGRMSNYRRRGRHEVRREKESEQSAPSVAKERVGHREIAAQHA